MATSEQNTFAPAPGLESQEDSVVAGKRLCFVHHSKRRSDVYV